MTGSVPWVGDVLEELLEDRVDDPRGLSAGLVASGAALLALELVGVVALVGVALVGATVATWRLLRRRLAASTISSVGLVLVGASLVLSVAVPVGYAALPAGVVVGSGGSMQPTLCDGSVLVVDRGAAPEVGDVVVVEAGGRRVIHRAVEVTPQHVVTMGDARSTVDRFPSLPGGYPRRSDVVGVVDEVVVDGCGEWSA